MAHPEYVLHVTDDKVGMEGFLVIDNLKRGIGKGGIRMAASVTEEEVRRLARTMTIKNAIADLPLGGAKSGIVWKGGSYSEKKKILRAFIKKIEPFLSTYYIGGPDIGTTEAEMALIARQAGRQSVTGKPFRMRGLPHELGSTGFGVVQAAQVAMEAYGKDIRFATVAIDGFGNVGSFAAIFLQAIGAKIVAVSDVKGSIYNPNGLDLTRLLKLRKKGLSVIDYPDTEKGLPQDALFQDVDLLITASVSDVIHDANKHVVRAPFIVEGSNIPMREEIEEYLVNHGKIIVPDIVANAGGVISSFAEMKGLGQKKMFELVEKKIKASTKEVFAEVKRTGKTPRQCAMEIAERRL